MAVSRSTPNGRPVRALTARISRTIWPVVMVAAPRQPKPPASQTATTRSALATPAIPASMTGCSMPSTSVSRVRMMPPGLVERQGPRRDLAVTPTLA